MTPLGSSTAIDDMLSQHPLPQDTLFSPYNTMDYVPALPVGYRDGVIDGTLNRGTS